VASPLLTVGAVDGAAWQGPRTQPGYQAVFGPDESVGLRASVRGLRGFDLGFDIFARRREPGAPDAYVRVDRIAGVAVEGGEARATWRPPVGAAQPGDGRFRFEVTATHPAALAGPATMQPAMLAVPPAAPPPPPPAPAPAAQSGAAQQVEACPVPKRLTVQGRVVIGDDTDQPLPPESIEIRVATDDNAAGPFVMIESGTFYRSAPQEVITLPPPQTAFGFSVPASARDSAGRCVFDGYLVVTARWKFPTKAGSDETTQTAVLPLHLVEPPPPGPVSFGEPERVVVMTPDGPQDGKYLWVEVGVDGPRTGSGTLHTRLRNYPKDRLTHYRAAFQYDSALTTSGGSRGRAIFGVPQDQTLLLRFFPDGDWFERADYLRLGKAERQRQRTGSDPSYLATLHAIPTSAVKGKKLALDAGHGVNLEVGEKRLYEWISTRQVTDHVVTLWENLGGTAVRTPTARFSEKSFPIRVDIPSLSTLTQGRTQGARMSLEIANGLYVYTVISASIPLADIAESIGYTGREQLFVSDYAPFFRTLEAKAPAPAGKPKFSVVPNSARWNGSGFTVDFSRIVKGKVESTTVPLRAAAGASLVLDPASVATLARESVRHSFRNEMRAEYEPYLRDPADPAEPSADVIDYAGLVLLETGEGRSLSPGGRRTFIQREKPDFAVTVHHNAAPDAKPGKPKPQAEGVLALLRLKASSSTALGLTGRRFLKYVDPLDSGRAGDGFFSATQNVSLVNPPPSDTEYVYLEIDFMDRMEGTELRYKRIWTRDFADAAARQIVAAVAEALARSAPQLQDMTPFNELP
jgi:hypothetical protein